MGASEWMIFAKYQPDIEKLIHELQDEAFRSGGYYNTWKYQLDQFRNFGFDEYNPYEYDERYRLSKAEYEHLRNLSKPETVEDLVKIQADGGTHCIIDIDGVSLTPQYRMATPVSEARLVGLFGTVKPTRTMVEALIPRFRDFIDGWMAVFVILYNGENPDEVFLYGITGD